MSRERFLLLLLFFGLLAAGCRYEGDPTTDPESSKLQEVSMAASTEVLPNTATPTPTNTPSPTSTSTPTNTPSPTPTPTPTAVPINLTGNPRRAILHEPEPQNNARCGIVDLLDFPLDPPDALHVRYGGEGFGRFRGRYDLYHAGEDWQLTRGRSNLGVPVYAIGHGRVTYAQPLGWGRDQGVIIIRHTFADGSIVLSFYGHMDPDSVLLRAGDCVIRGQKIAEIGQPRTPPHLHFEIRTHMPNEPGPGYWAVDPTEAGWLPPSQFIWNNRMASMPGVVWTRFLSSEGAQNFNFVADDILIALDNDQFSGVDLADGRLRWQQPVTNRVASAIFDANQPLLYTADWSGDVAAYSLLEDDDGSTILSEDPVWLVDSSMVGAPTLLPLPGGGVVATVREELTALSADGGFLWREEIEQRPYDWLLTDDHLFLTVSGNRGPIYSVDTSGLHSLPILLKGHPISVGDQIWLYADEGIYRLDLAMMTAELLYHLPQSLMGTGKIVALPSGGALVAHREIGDSRLIAFDADGSVRWQRSYAQLEGRELDLLLHKGQPYLLMQSGSGLSMQIKLYAIDIRDSTIDHIFTGGLRSSAPSSSWIESAGDVMVMNIGGGNMVALNPETSVPTASSSAD